MSVCSDPGFYAVDDGCQHCPVGMYCEGKLSPPRECPENHTTAGSASSSFSDCVCVKGFYREGADCVPCKLLSYKAAIGDQECTTCPQPATGVASNQTVLASTPPSVSMFAHKLGATQQSDCDVCATGYYFDAVSTGGCVPCKKDEYCPGFGLGVISCKGVAVTNALGAESAFNCGWARVSSGSESLSRTRR